MQGKSGGARELLLTLADYFRYNLNYDAYMVPLREELEHVKDYLQIEKARFEEKLQVTYDVPEKMEILVPTLILQPLVENAVQHGIKNKTEKGMIDISGCSLEGTIILTVWDNGEGISAGNTGSVGK